MKILIISGGFFPENSPRSFRTTELTKELILNGHDITIYIPENDYDYFDFIKKFPIKIIKFNFYKGKRNFLNISIIDRIIFRFLNQFCSYPDTFEIKYVYNAVNNEKDYDLLITIAVPHSIHWAVGKLYSQGNRIAKYWIADCGDPYMLRQSGKYRPMFYFSPLEKRWCKYCNYITVPTEAAKDGYYPEFRDKIHVIPQGFNFDEVKLKDYIPNKIPTFAFSGSFISGKRDIRPILDILIKIDKPFKLYVYTKQIQMLESYKMKLKDKLIVHNYIPRLKLLEFLSTMDFLLNLENGITVQTPSKLIDYALVKRPILSIDSSRINVNVINEFLDGNYSHQYIVENIEQYNIKNVVYNFLKLIKN